MNPSDPSDFYHGDDFREGANAELTEPDYSVAEFAAAMEAVVQSPPSFSLGGDDFLLHTIEDEMEALEKLDHEFQSRSDIDVYFSNSDRHQGAEHMADDWNQAGNNLEEATATHEYGGSNNLADSVASDELDHFKNQEHSLFNYKSSQGASYATLPEAIGDEDETQSTSGANIDGEELESNSGAPRVGMVFFSEEAVYDFYNSYAKETGFNVRRGKAEYSGSNKAVIKAKYFLCSCQGHKSKEQIDKPTRYKRRDTRTGCDAKIKCMVNDGTWTISKVVLGHNHGLKGCFAGARGRVEDSWATTALSTGKIVDKGRMAGEQALVSDGDRSDNSRGTWKNRPLPEPEDIQDLIDHFKTMQIKDPSFFHTAQVEAAHGMGNFFWRDSRFSKYLSPLSDQPGVGNLFSECIFHVHSEEEFESKWNCFVGKYKLHENTWLASLYGMRKKWSNAFTKNVFSAGLLSIQKNEDARAVFGNFSCETMTLSQIAHRCGKVAERTRKEEFLEDKHCDKNTASLISRSAVEKEAESLYTKPIFRMFQAEMINALSLAIEESGGTATQPEFKLTEEGSTKIDTVKFDPSNSTLACSCQKFESVGILCFHALKVLNSKNIFKIPSRYLLKRWTKSAKDSLPMDTPSAGSACDGGPVNSFIGEFMRKALHVAHVCATKKRERIALKSIDLALEHIAKAPRTEEIAVAHDDSDSEDDMGQTICNDALETQLNQGNVAKSGMGCPRVKGKVECHRPAGKPKTGYTRQSNRGLTQSHPKRAYVRAQMRPTPMSDRRSKHAS
ncbi:hypothetical protein NL676_030663 [Syzygium grande]|nr:hypothetical protein NL676_030663 [Syzygium grande]